MNLKGSYLRFNFFIWNLHLNKILTLNHIKSRSWNLANRCVMCALEESMNQLFGHWMVSHKAWDFYLSHQNISWAFLRDLIFRWWIKDMEGIRKSFSITRQGTSVGVYGRKGTKKIFWGISGLSRGSSNYSL